MKKYLCLAVIMFLVALLPTASGAQEEDSFRLQSDAIARIERFVDHFRKTGDNTSRIGDLRAAESELGATLEAFAGRGDFASAALSLIKLGQIQRMQGKWQAGLTYFQQAESMARRANHPGHRAKALMGAAQCEDGLRDYGAAASHVEQAITLATPLADKSFLFDALDILAQIQIKQGNLNAAADSLNRAFALPGMKDESRFYGLLDRGDIYLKIAEKCDYQSNFDACFQALDRCRADYKNALAIARKLGWTGLAQQTEGLLRGAEARAQLVGLRKRFEDNLQNARIFHPQKPSDVLVTENFVGKDLSMPPEMEQLYQESKRTEQMAGGFGDSVAVTSFYTDGLMQQSRGNRSGALASFLKAISVLERDRRKLQDEKVRGTFVESKIEVYYAAIQQLLDERRYAEAFELMERSRARAMADLLATRQLNFAGKTEQALYAENIRLKTNIATRQAELFRLINSGAKREVVAPIDHDIGVLEEAHRKLLARISAQAPRLLQLTTSQPVTLGELQKQMKKEGFEVLEYLVIKNAVILWHIDANGVRVKNVFLPRSELLAKVEALQKSLADRYHPFDHKTARELFLFLIQPVLASVRSDRLVIIPHDALHSIPFQVLENPADGTSFGERFQLSYAPSASVYSSLRKTTENSARTLMAAADPGIMEAGKEVESVAALYPSRSKIVKDVLITEADVKRAIGDYDVIHLSVHGKFNSEEPMLSYLTLAKGGQDDGRLTAAEMFGLPLGKSSLVVFSACETGKAQVTYSNEVLGMTRALLYAGASTLVLSYWKVDSASTALWMESFHRAAKSSPPAEAARRALVAVKQRREYAHPYFWSAFMLVTK